MNWRLALLGRTLIPSVKLHMLDELTRVTAEGFETDVPGWTSGTFAARLEEYARFTAHQAGLLLAAGDAAATDAVRDRLRDGATRLGTSLRGALGIRDAEEAFDALKLLYGQLGIEVAGGESGEITVGRCYFAGHYNEGVCRVVEALDQGIVAGLFDGATLEFSERLTGGRPCCRASLETVRVAG